MISIKMKELPGINLSVKLESHNPTGSVKDRAAAYILRVLLEKKIIDGETTILESTSGNFGVSLSAYCKYFGLRFIAVVDPSITLINEMLIEANGGEIVKVTQPDPFGGYLLTRIQRIRELKEQIRNSYWVNQYENPLNARAYYYSLGKEICFQVDDLDYIFLGVSSGGTITGVSKKVKENFPFSKVIAVDVEGSVIFNNPSKKRYIPGIGSSMVPKILKDAYIDDVVIVDEYSTIRECHNLLKLHHFFVGGSSGSVIAGVKKYFADKELTRQMNVVSVFPDRGERYFDTIYNKGWCDNMEKILATRDTLAVS